MLRVPIEELIQRLYSVLIRLGFSPERAGQCARLFAETTCDGVYTHGLARFPRFVEMIRNGTVKVEAEPVVVARQGAMERWDGRSGPGNLNAWAAMHRAMELATEYGVGTVALANTNHWMRGGSYGWQAATAGFLGVCWTNTLPNLPPWGGARPLLGNNPLVIAVPRTEGHVVLDMAMSQYSYGAIERYRKEGKELPFEGGFDREGRLTRDPAAIEDSQRALPIGYWKGAGLSLMLDLLAATLAQGQATHQIPATSVRETGLSQVFLAFSVEAASARPIADAIVASLHPGPEEAGVRYPGEQTLRLREENLRLGVPVDEEIWAGLDRL